MPEALIVLRRAMFLAQMLRNESLTPSALATLQTRQLRMLLRHARERVPFYRDLYASHGIRAASGDAPHDLLQSIPMVDKTMLRAAGATAVSLDAPADRVTINTSGSSGEPFRFQIDRRYDQWRKAQYLRPYLSAGQRLRDKVLRLTGRPERPIPWFSRLGLLREWRIHSAADPTRMVEAWRRLSPHVLQGWPSALRSLAHHCIERGQPLSPAPRLVFTDSELLLPDTRALLERAFGTAPIDIFGTFESDNIAYQCALRGGYHIATDSVVLEIVRDGKSVPIGEAGEIVVTVLRNRTTPFIRYNLRDIGRLSTHPCPCGLPFPLLAVVQGRVTDLLTLPDGRRCTPQGIFAGMNNLSHTVRHYQLRQTATGVFEFLIVPARQLASLDRQEIIDTMRPTVGNARIELHLVEAIPPDPSGKRRLFIPRPETGESA
jgi:phenylacetate-coenzyme A ligase PaaK-like adenylate-forming protein